MNQDELANSDSTSLPYIFPIDVKPIVNGLFTVIRFCSYQHQNWLIGINLPVINLIASKAATEPITENTGKNSHPKVLAKSAFSLNVSFNFLEYSWDHGFSVLKLSIDLKYFNNVLKIISELSNDKLKDGFSTCILNGWWLIEIDFLIIIAVPLDSFISEKSNSLVIVKHVGEITLILNSLSSNLDTFEPSTFSNFISSFA